MTEKVYRLRLSSTIDRDIVSFIESVPSTRRAELLRHIIRFYISQLKDDAELFIFTDISHNNPHKLSINGHTIDEERIEYRIRLDKKVDSLLIHTAEKVPRNRRSEFWRHIMRYYISHIEDGEVFIMPEESNSRSEEHTSELQSRGHLVCRLLL